MRGCYQILLYMQTNQTMPIRFNSLKLDILTNHQILTKRISDTNTISNKRIRISDSQFTNRKLTI
jgi:hypothetical protein